MYNTSDGFPQILLHGLRGALCNFIETSKKALEMRCIFHPRHLSVLWGGMEPTVYLSQLALEIPVSAANSYCLFPASR